MRSQINSIAEDYDFILIDTPPHFGLLLSAALIAATHVLVPVQAAPFALDGLEDLLKDIEKMHRLNDKLQILGLVSTLYDGRTLLAKECRAELLKVSQDKKLHLFDTIIHRDIRLEASSGSHQPIQLYASNAPSVERFELLTAEISDRLISGNNKLRIVTDSRKVVNE